MILCRLLHWLAWLLAEAWKLIVIRRYVEKADVLYFQAQRMSNYIEL